MVSQVKIQPFCEEMADGSLRYNFTPPQMRAMQSTAKITALLCGAQFGKTILGPPWLNQKMTKYGDGDYLAGTTNFPLLDKKMLPAYDELFNFRLGVARYKDKGNKMVWNDGKITIFFCTAEKPSSMESATAICAHFDEVGQDEWKEQSWNAARSRLAIASNPVEEGGLGAGDTLITTTLYNFGWLKYKIYDRWLAGDPAIDVIHADSIENPTFPVKLYYELKAQMSESDFDLRYRGRYTRPKGMVYDSFDSKTSVLGRELSPVQGNWPIYCGMDFGTEATAAVFYAVDPSTGFYYCIGEYFGTGRTTAENVAEMEKVCSRAQIIKCCGGKGDKDDDGWRGDFTKAGWPVSMPSIRSVQQGIERVYAFHKLGKLYYFIDETKILAEKSSYSYKLDEKGDPTGDIQNKQHYHFMDAERYILGEFNLSLANTSQMLRPIRASYGY